MRRLAPRSSTLALLALCLPATGCDLGRPELRVEEGIPRTLAGHRSATLSELHYAYDLTVPRDRKAPVEGRVAVRFRWDDPDRLPVVLDFRRPGERVRALRVNGQEAPRDTVADHLVIGAGLLQRGVMNQLEVEFTAGDEALNRNDGFLYTLFVPDRAHFSLPVFDQPDLKGRVSFALTIPADWTAIANGPLAADTTEGDARTLRFGESRPLPSYLFAFTAGDFDEVTARRAGRTLRFLHRETDADKVARNVEEILDLEGQAIEWMEDYTGIPYPFQSFGFVAVPSFQYGGMEHPGTILYRASRLFLDASATQGDLLGRASLVAHETAHMWFGDLVTMEWFDDVWTKEVFANFFAAKIAQPAFPELNHDLRFLLAHQPTAYAVDRTPGANPIRQPLENLNEAGTLYGAIIYQKAPVVMRQLEALVGPETFRDGMREYLEAHRYGNATWPDLVGVLDRRTDQDLAAWSRTWVEEPGRPTVTVVPAAATRDGTSASASGLALVQQDPAGEGRIWPQALTVGLGRAADSLEAVSVHLLTARAPVPGTQDRSLPSFVLPDVSGLGYGHMHLDEATRTWLLEHAFEIRDDLARGEALVTLQDGLIEGELNPDAYLTLLLHGTELEQNELVVEELLGDLRTVFWRFLTPEARRARAAEVEGALWEGVLEAENGRTGTAFFRAYRDVALTDDGVRLLRRVWAGDRPVPGVTLSEEDRTTLALELAARGVAGWKEVLDRQEEAIENPDRLARFRFVRPAVDADPAVRGAFFRSLLEPENREREPWALEALSYLNHPLRAEVSRAFIRPALDEVWEVQRTGDIFFPKRWLDAALSGHSTPEAAGIVRRFLDELPEDYPSRLRGKVLQAADPVFRAARVVYGWEG